MSKGISNFQIDKFFKEQNEELQKTTWELIPLTL